VGSLAGAVGGVFDEGLWGRGYSSGYPLPD